MLVVAVVLRDLIVLMKHLLDVRANRLPEIEIILMKIVKEISRPDIRKSSFLSTTQKYISKEVSTIQFQEDSFP